MAKAARTTSPYQQAAAASKLSGAERRFEAGAMTVPSWARIDRLQECGCEKKRSLLHQAEDALAVDRRLAKRPPGAVQQRGDAAVAASRPRVGNGAYLGQEFVVSGSRYRPRIRLSRCRSWPIRFDLATPRVSGQGLHCKPAGGGDGKREMSYSLHCYADGGGC